MLGVKQEMAMVGRLTRANACREGYHGNQQGRPSERLIGMGYDTDMLFREALRQNSLTICNRLLERGVVKLPEAINQSSLEYDDLDPEMQRYIREKLGDLAKSANDE